jgi:hypothetical protein
MKKRIVALLLVVCAISLVASPAFAGTQTEVIDGVAITATCNLHSSFHSVVKTGTYPAGSARIYYVYNGQDLNTDVSGVSTFGRWEASTTLTSTQNAYKATTTRNGYVVTAFS